MGVNQTELSQRLGITAEIYQLYESAETAPPVELLNSLYTLGYSTEWLLNDIGPMKVV